MELIRNVVLTGFMGSGKSVVGNQLSSNLSIPWIDTDNWIEEKTGMTIQEIFKEHGEDFFREWETKCLEELLRCSSKQVISVGGGLPIRERNQELLRELGVVIYLSARPEDIYERVAGDQSRPLLQGDDLQEKILHLWNERRLVYENCADITVVTTGKSIDETAEEIIRLLCEHNERSF